MKPHTFVLAVSLALTSVAAVAQWQWIDKDGRKVYSDRPPPADTPLKSILRSPGSRGPTAASHGNDTPAVAAAAAPAASAAAAPTELDRALEARRRAAQQAKAQSEQAEQERVAAARRENCERARQAKATLDSGVRIRRPNAQGEPEVLDDAARAAEQRRLQAVLASECSSQAQ